MKAWELGSTGMRWRRLVRPWREALPFDRRTACPPDVSHRLAYLLAGVSLSIASLVLLAIVAEVFLRVFNPVDLDWRMVVSHPVRIEALAPGFDGSFKGTPVRTNEFGHRIPTMRERHYGKEKPAGVKRVLVYGGSFAFGDEWPAEESLVEHLQRRLDPTFTRVQVLNFGVPGYTAYQKARYIQESALDFQPDAVIVVFADINDLIPVVDRPRPAASLATVKRWLRRHSYAYSMVFDVWYHGRDSGLGKALRRLRGGDSPATTGTAETDAALRARLAEMAGRYYRQRLEIIEKNELGWRQAYTSYREIAAFLATARIPLLIVAASAPWDVECRAWNCRSVKLTYGEVVAMGRPLQAALSRHLGGLTRYYLSHEQVLGQYTLEDLYEDGRLHYGPRKNAILAARLEPILGTLGIEARARSRSD